MCLARYNRIAFTRNAFTGNRMRGFPDIDPSEEWSRREIDSFNNCIIPLTQKLKESGVFGLSSDEYLNCAAVNRREREARVSTLSTRTDVHYDWI
jgi:hypothetical protein